MTTPVQFFKPWPTLTCKNISPLPSLVAVDHTGGRAKKELLVGKDQERILLSHGSSDQCLVVYESNLERLLPTQQPPRLRFQPFASMVLGH